MKTKDNIQYAPCTDCGDNYKNPDYYSFVIVRNITERNNLPCKLRQNGMIAVVIEENFKHYQIQTTPEIGACNNSAWVAIDSGGSSLSNENLLIFNSLDAAQSYILSVMARDGQMLYVIEQALYYKLEDAELVDPFPNKLDNISNILTDTTNTTRLIVENSKTGIYSKIKAPFNIEDNKLRVPSNNVLETDGPVNIQGVNYESNKDRKVISIGSRPPYLDLPFVTNGISTGFNIASNYIGKDEGYEGYSKSYILYGTDIFEDFTGNTQYRPGHPAHDSLVAFGTGLGKGVKDGTNFTLFGTGLFTKNDVPYWDSITAMGKGIFNNRFPDGQPRPANREVYPISSPGVNIRGLMSGVVAIGNEHWFGDIHSSTIIGQSTKVFDYVFNSVVIGNQNQNFNAVKYPGETIPMQLDNDVIIGNGIYKDPKKYPKTHNLLIGSTLTYANGGWDQNYVPLIEGNFKDKTFKINGSTEVEESMYIKTLNDRVPSSPNSLNLPLVAGLTWDFEETVTFNNAQPGSYKFGQMLSNKTYIFEIEPIEWSSGTWGYNFGTHTDSGNGIWTVSQLYTTGSNVEDLIFSLTGVSTGKLKMRFKEVLLDEQVTPSITFKDSATRVSNEIRVTPQKLNNTIIGRLSGAHIYNANNITIYGYNSFSSLVAGSISTVIGSQSAPVVSNTSDSTIIGANNLKLAKSARAMTIVGNENLANATAPSFLISLGNRNFADTNTGKNLIAVGNDVQNKNNGDKTIAIGTGSAYDRTNVSTSILIGHGANTAQDNSSNEIVIGVSGAGKGSNTTTIGTGSTTMTYLHGTVTSNVGFKIEGKTDNDILLAGGGSKSIYDTLRDGLLQMSSAERAEILRILNT